MMASKTKKFTMMLSEEERQKLTDLAAREDRSLGAWVRHRINREHLSVATKPPPVSALECLSATHIDYFSRYNERRDAMMTLGIDPPTHKALDASLDVLDEKTQRADVSALVARYRELLPFDGSKEHRMELDGALDNIRVGVVGLAVRREQTARPPFVLISRAARRRAK